MDAQQNKDDKQYFDIKKPSKPDPTSRPVINSEPIQTDPMVSVSTVDHDHASDGIVTDDSASPEATEEDSAVSKIPDSVSNQSTNEVSVSETDPALNVDDHSKLNNSETSGLQSDPISDEDQKSDENEGLTPVAEIATDQPTDVVSETHNTDSTVSLSGDSSLNEIEIVPESNTSETEPPSNQVQPDIQVGGQSNEVPETIVSPVVSPDSLSLNQEALANSSVSPTPMDQPKTVNSHGFFRYNLGLKIVIGILILILISITAFFVYKYKSGQ